MGGARHLVRRWVAGATLPPVPAIGIEARPLTMSDAAALGEPFWRGFGSEGEDGYQSAEAAMREAAETLAGKWGPVNWGASLVATLDGRMVTATVVVADDAHEMLPLLAFLVTDPDYRGRGIARGLVGETLRRMDAAGTHESHLAVQPDNPAQALYQQLGFTTPASTPGP